VADEKKSWLENFNGGLRNDHFNKPTDLLGIIAYQQGQQAAQQAATTRRILAEQAAARNRPAQNPVSPPTAPRPYASSPHTSGARPSSFSSQPVMGLDAPRVRPPLSSRLFRAVVSLVKFLVGSIVVIFVICIVAYNERPPRPQASSPVGVQEPAPARPGPAAQPAAPRPLADAPAQTAQLGDPQPTVKEYPPAPPLPPEPSVRAAAQAPQPVVPATRPFVAPPTPGLNVTVDGNVSAQSRWYVRFFDETTGARWPANPLQAYPYQQSQVDLRLACFPNDVVCYGAWRSDRQLFVGVGPDNDPSRRDERSCRRCTSDLRSWHLPSPEPR
jgi:hypothetical protein